LSQEENGMNFRGSFFLIAVAAVIFFFAPASAVTAQGTAPFKEYRGVTIGMSAAEARAKLGKAKETTDSEDYYEFDNDETARIIFDENKKVRAISINYDGDHRSTPTPEAVLGQSVPPRPDGGFSKMVEFKKSGFWISYVRTGGSNPLIIITMQKIQE
jgi:hypothetical protein